MAGNFRKLIRNLRKANEALEEVAEEIEDHCDCPECGSRNSVKFLRMNKWQTRFFECWKCGDTIRVRKEV